MSDAAKSPRSNNGGGGASKSPRPGSRANKRRRSSFKRQRTDFGLPSNRQPRSIKDIKDSAMRDEIRTQWTKLAEEDANVKGFLESILRYLVKSDSLSDKNKSEWMEVVIVVNKLTYFLIGGAFLIHVIERWTVLDSLWWAWITLSTIGYGDKVPDTLFGEMVTSVYIIMGVGYLSGALSTGAAYLSKRRKEADLAVALEEERVKREAWEASHFISADASDAEIKAVVQHIKHRSWMNEFEETMNDVSSTMHKTVGAAKEGVQNLMEEGSRVIGNVTNHELEIKKADAAQKRQLRYFWYKFSTLLGSVALCTAVISIMEGWDGLNAFYFVIQTTTTVGYGDQSSLYPLNGMNITAGETTREECEASRGSCTVAREEPCGGPAYNMCSCTFSDTAKVFIMFFSCGSLAMVGEILEAGPVIVQLLPTCGKKRVHVEEGATEGKNGRFLWVTKNMILTPVLTILYICLLGILLFRFLEPDFSSDGNEGLVYSYFAIVTLTTIGFGDYSPTTPTSKIVWVLYTLIGFVLVGFFTGHMSAAFKWIGNKVTMTTVSRYNKWVQKTKLRKLKKNDRSRLTIQNVMEGEESDVKPELNAQDAIDDMDHLSEQSSDLEELDEDDTERMFVIVSIIQTLILATVNVGVILHLECGPDKTIDECGAVMPMCEQHSVWRALYFSIITMSTVGYGNRYYPTTPGAQLWMCIFSMASLGNFAMFVQSLALHRLKRHTETLEAMMEQDDERTGMNQLEIIMKEGIQAEYKRRHSHFRSVEENLKDHGSFTDRNKDQSRKLVDTPSASGTLSTTPPPPPPPPPCHLSVSHDMAAPSKLPPPI